MSGAMKLKFKVQPYQTNAVDSVVDGFTFHLGPKRPWRGVEFWRGGVEIDRASALEILKEYITDEWEFL